MSLKLEEIISMVQFYGSIESTNDQKVSEFRKEPQNVLDELKTVIIESNNRVQLEC